MIQYRILNKAEITQFMQIDRREIIEHVYVVREGALVLRVEHFDVPDWPAAEKIDRLLKLKQLYERGATFFGAFDDAALVGLAVLEHNFLPSGQRRLNLAGMWVSQGYRGQAIGRTLFQWAAQEAHKKGAFGLYVSATPSQNTVQFYLNMGCRWADPIDPELLAAEPDDIHLELVLFEQGP